MPEEIINCLRQSLINVPDIRQATLQPLHDLMNGLHLRLIVLSRAAGVIGFGRCWLGRRGLWFGHWISLLGLCQLPDAIDGVGIWTVGEKSCSAVCASCVALMVPVCSAVLKSWNCR